MRKRLFLLQKGPTAGPPCMASLPLKVSSTIASASEIVWARVNWGELEPEENSDDDGDATTEQEVEDDSDGDHGAEAEEEFENTA